MIESNIGLIEENELYDFYFDWLTRKVFETTNVRDEYWYLLNLLNNQPFCYSLQLDKNRYADGIDLRNRFCWELEIEPSYSGLLGTDCSVLEMMVALAIRCETNIMADSQYGDRTPLWFKVMLINMHLIDQTNENFDPRWAEERVEILNNREYDYNGDGGLFKLMNVDTDMRTVDIWCQLCWYLNEN